MIIAWFQGTTHNSNQACKYIKRKEGRKGGRQKESPGPNMKQNKKWCDFEQFIEHKERKIHLILMLGTFSWKYRGSDCGPVGSEVQL